MASQLNGHGSEQTQGESEGDGAIHGAAETHDLATEEQHPSSHSFIHPLVYLASSSKLGSEVCQQGSNFSILWPLNNTCVVQSQH